MRLYSAFPVLAILLGTFVIAPSTKAQENLKRNELSRTDLAVGPDMEVITSTLEAMPGAFLPRHTHPGVESVYILQGGWIQPLKGDKVEMVTGGSVAYARDVPHAGFTVVGDRPIKLLNIHVVDKGKPVMVPAP